MRFKEESLGSLVRPRILDSSFVVELNSSFSEEINKFCFPKTIKRKYQANVFSQPAHILFNSLKLGNTTETLNNAYVGQVVGYVVKIGSHQLFVDKQTIQEVTRKMKVIYGKRTILKIIAVGLKFFCGIESTKDKLRPINPWNPLSVNKNEVLWFYEPSDLVSIEDIIKYEKIQQGQIVLFQNCQGLVVKKKLLNKPKFYSTSSWSCYCITLLNHKGSGFTRFIPDRFFETHE